MINPYDAFKSVWRTKTIRQIERELKSWRAYMDRYSSAYSWHGRGITPPGSISDGDKVTALKELIDEKSHNRTPAQREGS